MKPRRNAVPGDNLATAAILLMVGVALAHGWAALSHFAEAAEHTEMGMAEEAAGLTIIAWGLTVSTVAGLLVAVWGVFVSQRRHHLPAYVTVVLAGYAAMILAGVASRTSVGLQGHTDPATPLWSITVAAEIAVLVLTAAYAAMIRGAQDGLIIGGATARVPFATARR
jgi:hypothetical protein